MKKLAQQALPVNLVVVMVAEEEHPVVQVEGLEAQEGLAVCLVAVAVPVE